MADGTTHDDPRIVQLKEVRGPKRIYEMSDGSVIERDGGTVAWRNNNPGNLKFEYAGDADQTHDVSRTKVQALAAAQKKYEGVVALDQWGNAVFDSLQHGREAKLKMIAGKGDMTLPELLKVYSKADYSGRPNHQEQEASILATADAQGVNLRGKKISAMTPKELSAMADGIGKFEGFKAGTEHVISGPTMKQSQAAAQVQESSVPRAQSAAPQAMRDEGIKLQAAYDLGIKYDNDRYAINVRSSPNYHPGVDGKHPGQGYVDCSGWVATVQNATMDEINAKAGRQVFGPRDKFNLGTDGSGEIVQKAAQRSGVLLEGTGVFAKGALKEGMVIGIDSGATSHDHWKGIDHIVTVVRDPKTGALLASQSSPSTKGVDMMPLDAYLEKAQHHHWKLYAADPLAKGRALLQEQTREHNLTPSARSVATGKAESGAGAAHGRSSEDMAAIQKQLASLGYRGINGYQLKGTGVNGENTIHAVKEFQSAHGLKVDGIVGPKTQEALKHAKDHPLINEAGHPSHGMYEQIKAQTGKLGGAKALGFHSDKEYTQALANMTWQAKLSGMTQVDHVVETTNGHNLVMIQGGLRDPAQQREVSNKAQAAQVPVEQSTQQLQQDVLQ
ncbi:MAG: peptidoglycan-binding protein, partial [Bacteroidetes bacterium]|nr:peptidoglycan-binding protein [Bacteroidota bacterium]